MLPLPVGFTVKTYCAFRDSILHTLVVKNDYLIDLHPCIMSNKFTSFFPKLIRHFLTT